MFRRNNEAFFFQTPVYVDARQFIIELGIKSVLDIGCGNPQKLKAYIYPFTDDIVGIDLQEVVDQVDEAFGHWFEADLDNDSVCLGRTFELIIAADVIEHLKSPIGLFDVIKRHADENTIILISTPEKTKDYPNNLSHETMYTGVEMASMLNENGLRVERAKSYVEKNAKPRYASNMFLCKKVLADGRL